MPVTLLDRLPLPNLKVYTAGSVLLLSISVYYAMSVTNDPNWRLNVTLQRQLAATSVAAADVGDGEGSKVISPSIAPLDLAINGSRSLSEQFVDVMTFMTQEPLCMWTLINIAYCSLALFGFLIQQLVFGKLRVSEAQKVKDKFWNYVFYKFIFVFGVINVQYMDEVLLWCSWFTIVGFLHLLGQLCKDRFEYLSSSPNTSQWAHIRLLALVGGILSASVALLAVAAAWGLPAGRDTFAFMAAECVLVLLAALHVMARFVLQLYEADVAGPVAYYTHLIFDWSYLIMELMHVIHMVVWSNMRVSMASLVLLMQLRHLLHELQARLRRHRIYTTLATHMSQNYPMASKEEVENNQDNCAICWEPMKEARKLPCSHLFHNSCLCQWVQHDASCPTCRRALAGTHSHSHTSPDDDVMPPPPRPLNHLFRFDGSRYVSWLPSFSVEVTRVRVRMEQPLASQIEAMARQMQQMFPHYPLSVLAADLAATRSPDLTADNILEGRLPLPVATTEQNTPREGTPEIEVAAGLGREDASTSVGRAFVDSTHTHVDNELVDAEEGSSQFARSSIERETLLQRRKQLLVANARKRYLEKVTTDSRPSTVDQPQVSEQRCVVAAAAAAAVQSDAVVHPTENYVTNQS